jgi:type I restriction enzyme S subunit
LHWPPKPERERIGKIFRSLNEKIELNHQTSQTLEEMAQAVFKSWFVDFDPTRAKVKAVENGQDPTRAAMASIAGKTVDQLDTISAEQIKSLTTAATLFPETLVESSLGETPEGWEVTDLKSTTSELRRGISPKYCDEGGVSVINQKCIRNHSVNFKLARLHDPIQRKVSGRQLELGDILVNSTGVGTLGRLAPVRFLEQLTVFDSHVTVVRADTSKISVSFLAGLMFEKEAFIEASGAGSTGQTELRKQVLEDIQFAKPTVDIVASFDALVVPIGQKISVLEQEHESFGTCQRL